MNSFKRKPNLLRPIALMLAVALPASAGISAELANVVKTRPDQNIDQQYGRDSVYAFSSESKPLKPEQTGARDLIGARSNFTISDASGFPSANAPLQTDPMDNDMATDPRPTDARTEGISMGSGYTGDTGQSFAQMTNANPYGGESFQSQYEQRAWLILPGTVVAPVASGSEDEASNEFVIIVPEMTAAESAALDKESGITVD
jgi:hypothetical protein